MPKIITDNDFKKLVYEKGNNEYEVLNSYKGIHEKIFFRHKTCEHEFYMAPNEFLHKGYRCPFCTGKLRRNTEKFKQEVFDKVGDEYTVLGEYVNSKEKVKIRHNTCGHEYFVAPTKFLSAGRRCPECSRSRTMTFQEVMEEFKEKNPEYIPTTNYQYMNKESLFIHVKCGKSFLSSPRTLLDGRSSCPYCRITKKSDEDVYKLKVQSDGYELISKFSKTSRMKFKCRTCGKEFYGYYNIPLECPKCKSQEGKAKIISFLIQRGHKIETDKQFNGKYACRPFDIYVKDLDLIIEYREKYHYKKNIIVNLDLEHIKASDKKKSEHINAHRRKALIIPYWEADKINEILVLLEDFMSPATSYTAFNIFRRDLHIESWNSYKKKK